MSQFENPRQQQSKQNWSQWAIDNIAGTYDDIAVVSKKLRDAARECHLIGGAAIPCLPEGHELQVTVIPVDISECYTMKRKDDREQKPSDEPIRYGIPKHTLMRIASAAGVEWVESRRIGAETARYVHWRVVLRYPLVDGTYRIVEGDKDCDYRDGSDQLRGKTEKEIPKLRENMVRATITKAKLRAIREAFGIAHGMTEKQLERPFVVCKAVFTGRSKDKENARLFARVIAEKQLMASRALYGALPALAGPPARYLPPKPTSIDDDPDLRGFDADGVVDEPPSSGEPPQAAEPPPPPVPPAEPVDDSPVLPTPNYIPRIGRSKGKPLSEAKDEELVWLEEVLAKNADDPDKARWRRETLGGLGAVRLELKRRGFETEEPAKGELDRGDDPNNW